jgi:DNA-binding NarL/FixJ family response regulator
MPSIRLILADDHHVVRQGMRALLEAQPDLSVVGEATDGLQLVKMVEALQPDVALVDVTMPNLNGIEAARQISKRFPHTRVVMLSMHSSTAYVLRALRSGALGYVLKDASFQEVVQSIRAAAQGQRYLSAQVSGRVTEALLKGADPSGPEAEHKLTDREREVLQLIAEGHTNVQIAEKLVISPRTVETHRARLMEKLSLNSQAELVRFAIQQGIIPLED